VLLQGERNGRETSERSTCDRQPALPDGKQTIAEGQEGRPPTPSRGAPYRGDHPRGARGADDGLDVLLARSRAGGTSLPPLKRGDRTQKEPQRKLRLFSLKLMSELKQLLFIIPGYQRTAESAVGILFAARKLIPGLLSLILSVKIW